ncbi:DUF3920 family protein [Bacillus sp. 165]|uniref:DUF3920 family protein n=1 Tax=Bacillus sp. 165 TaxID=1529117 RepID=UPI001ADCC47A|nr:DUF3920 family protein [Bacillus sp. 165]MBO9130756.1 DUF3920 family protein [Bacillus sp. 165]
MQFPFQRVFQQAGLWYVLDEEFPWDLHKLQQDIFSLMMEREVRVLFCDTCDANAILSVLGEEEEEFLYPLSGLYHPGARLIFVFQWEEYEVLLGTLLHELRHDMQFEEKTIRDVFYKERRLNYEERWIEKDAQLFVKNTMEQYYKKEA